MARVTTNIYFPAPQVKIMLEGNWQKVTTAVSGIGSAIQRGYDRAVSRYARNLLQIIKGAIQSGNPPNSVWEPHSDSTMRTYKSHGWVVGQPYYRTGVFYRSLSLYEYRGRTYVGLPSGIRTENGLTLVQLARLLESGSDKIPARPLFAPSFQAAGGTTELRKQILKSIRQELSHLGFRANQVKF